MEYTKSHQKEPEKCIVGGPSTAIVYPYLCVNITIELALSIRQSNALVDSCIYACSQPGPRVGNKLAPPRGLGN